MEEETNRHVKRYFKKIYSYYQKSVNKKGIASLRQRIRNEIEPVLKGKVVDIGSGGVTHYNNGKINLLISLDNVFEFLKNCKYKNVLNLNGDIKNIPLKDNSIDFIIIQFVIHHLTENNFKKNINSVKRAILESSRILKKGGTVYIVDSMVPSFLEKLEMWNYKIIYHFLRILGKPMIFFFSIQNLHNILKENDLILDKIIKIDWGETKEASQALFPWLRFPLKYSPVKCILISANKY